MEESFRDNAYIFDLDGTIFDTAAKIIVKDKDTGEVIKELTPAEYISYRKQPTELYDVSQFQSPEVFTNTAVPTKYFNVIRQISNAIRRGASNSFIYILTARGNAIKPTLIKELQSRGIIIRPNEIFTVGDIDDKTDIATAKKQIIKNIRNKHIGNVVFFDDDKRNIQLASEVPGVITRWVRYE